VVRFKEDVGKINSGGRYVKTVLGRASVYWPEDKAMEEGKWQVVGITLSSAAEDFIVTPI